MDRNVPLLAIVTGVVACSAVGHTPPRQAAARVPAEPKGGRVLGTIDGVAMTEDSLDPEVRARLQETENEYKQRELQLLWTGFEAVVAQRLLAKEAARKGIPVEKLIATEIDGKVTPPSQEEVRAFFDANQRRIDVPFESAKTHIRAELMRERVQTSRRTLVEQLRAGVEVRYRLPDLKLPRVGVEIGRAPQLGPSSAKVTLIEFADFECPYCVHAHRMLKRLHDIFPKQLRVVYRDLPLRQHSRARPAAEAAHCAHEQQKFWSYHDRLYDNSEALGDEDLRRYAEQVGIQVPAFEQCLASKRPASAIRDSEAAAQRMGVEGTPAIFLNGIKLIGLLPLPLMRALIEQELERLGDT